MGARSSHTKRIRFRVIVTIVATAGLGLTTGPADAVTRPGQNGLVAQISATLGLVALNPVTGVASQLAFGTGALNPEVHGSKVAYVRGGTIRIADWPSGLNEVQVTETAGAASPTFTPNGQTIVFQCPAGAGICSVPAAGGAVTQLTGGAATDNDPDVSPDGMHVIVGVAGTGVFQIPINGGPRTLLTGTENAFTFNVTPRFAPSGDMVYYNCLAGVCSVPFPGGGPTTTILGTQARSFTPTPSPDGTKLLFQHCAPPGFTCAAATDGVFSVPLPGGGAVTRVDGTQVGDATPGDALHWATAAPSVPPVTNAAPAFSADSSCGAVSILRLHPWFGPTTASVSASDAAGQSVTLSATGLPSVLTFTSTPGNPATATIGVSTNPAEFFNKILALFGPPIQATITATDNGSPVQSSTCQKTFRIVPF